MHNERVDRIFLEDRLRTIGKGLKEGIRREVNRLRELGLPIDAAENGHLVDYAERQIEE